MALTNNEIQRKFKEKMYKAGLRQTIIWIKKKEKKEVKMTRKEFEKALNKIIAGLGEDKLSKLYNLLIKAARGKKEADKLKKK